MSWYSSVNVLNILSTDLPGFVDCRQLQDFFLLASGPVAMWPSQSPLLWYRMTLSPVEERPERET
jgi:hypothetical protein